MKVIDLSHTIENFMQVFPGSAAVRLESVASVEDDGYAEKEIHISSHVGTHIDVPAHLFHGGETIDSMSPDRFIGRGFCLPVPGDEGSVIHRRHLEPFEESISGAEFLLLASGWESLWGTEQYQDNFPLLSRDAANYLTGFALKGIGVDTISVDPVNSIHLTNHNLLLEHMLIVENLCGLAPLNERTFVFSCLPLKICGGDGSPVRAVAILD